MRGVLVGLLVAGAAAFALPPAAQASSDLDLPGCRTTTLPRNDDDSSGRVTLPFTLGFYGTEYSSLFVNNNGNVTFDSPLAEYVPFDLTRTQRVIIAPFFADVDTRPANGGTVTYGTTTYDGRPAFCVLWDEVGYYANGTDRRNTFQLLLVSSGSRGDFDIVFRYARVQWELGSASDGVPARAGFSNGVPASSVELAGSARPGAFLDGGPNSLVAGSINSGQSGTWLFRVRGGTPGNDPANVPPGVGRDTNWWDWADDDNDGLPDHWERNGVRIGDRVVDLAALGARPGQRDAFVYVDVVQGERWNDTIETMLTSNFRQSPLDIHMHIVRGRTLERSEVPAGVAAGDFFFSRMARLGFNASGLAGSPGSVPALAKYVCVCPDHVEGDGIGGQANGTKADHLVVTMNERKWLNDIKLETGVSFDSADGYIGDRLNAITTMHELGHLYGLKHHGAVGTPEYSREYKSIMSYSYNAFGVPSPAGVGTAYSIDYSRESAVNLDWRLGGGFGALSLVYGQHGERGDFYTSVAEVAPAADPPPDEAPIERLLADPETREAIREGAAGTLAQLAASPPPSTPPLNPAPPTVQRDTKRPTVKFSSIRFSRIQGRGARTRARVTVRFTAKDASRVTVRCKLDIRKAKSCRSPLVLKNIRAGRHTIRIIVTDAAGNRTTAKRTFTVRRR